MKKLIILYTMDGCPHCLNIKESLNQEDIDYIEHNIKDYEKEYESFVKETKNEYLPAFTLLTIKENNKHDIEFLTPEDSFDDLNEAVDKIKKFLL